MLVGVAFELDAFAVVVDDSDVTDDDDGGGGCDADDAVLVMRCRSVVPGELVFCVVEAREEEEGEGQATTSTSFLSAVMVSTFGNVADTLSVTLSDDGCAGTERPWMLAEFVLFWDIPPVPLNNDLLVVAVDVVVVVVDGLVKVVFDAEDEVNCFD